MNITVFGGSEPKNGEKAYEDALRLGRLLGAEGSGAKRNCSKRRAQKTELEKK